MKDYEEKDNITSYEDNKPLALDDSKRVKVLSPGMLVFKRFIRNKLAIVGSIILIFMFLFTFLGGVISPYGEKEVFHINDYMESEYAKATKRTEYINIMLTDIDVHYSVSAMLNSYILSFTEGQNELAVSDDEGNDYILSKMGESCYLLKKIDSTEVAVYNILGASFTFTDLDYDNEEFKNLVMNSLNSLSFTYGGDNFKIVRSGKSYKILREEDPIDVILTTTLVFDSYATNEEASTDFKVNALRSLYGTKTFIYNNVNYEIEGDETLYTVYSLDGAEKEPFMNISHFVVRRYNGEDTLSIDYKLALEEEIIQMENENLDKKNFIYEIYDINTNEITQENYVIYRSLNNFVVKNQQLKYLIDIHSPPSIKHWLGTDANGMDVLTRMMYGGRISLMIGFIVIIIELFIGVILGGVAGYFGKWLDQLIMRIVDIFNSLPFLPIMIIIGAIFDKQQMDPYTRIIWLMVVMGIMGWAFVARLVRGQILSLREQEFMIAAEASGLSIKRRIFRHLIPNVMPQLIVNATMGLGNIILIESTLSFLGLGAKYPIATWGAMIYSVSTASDLVKFTYIWIPVGLLICLTVIAFNFVGDGLRDAYDPKMKR